MVYDFLLICLGCMFGMILSRIIRNYTTRKATRKLREQVDSIFQQVLDNINVGRSSFYTRVNNNVTIKTNLNGYGTVNIMYLMDKKDIAIFSGESCIYTTDMVDKKIVDSIIERIELFYKIEMNDIVNVMGMVYYRLDFEKRFNVKIEDLKKNMFGQGPEMSDVDKIIHENKAKFSIDTILDRINSVGIENLTDAEKKFLENYNNGK